MGERGPHGGQSVVGAESGPRRQCEYDKYGECGWAVTGEVCDVVGVGDRDQAMMVAKIGILINEYMSGYHSGGVSWGKKLRIPFYSDMLDTFVEILYIMAFLAAFGGFCWDLYGHVAYGSIA